VFTILRPGILVPRKVLVLVGLIGGTGTRRDGTEGSFTPSPKREAVPRGTDIGRPSLVENRGGVPS
jgi:hypothetical protein